MSKVLPRRHAPLMPIRTPKSAARIVESPDEEQGRPHLLLHLCDDGPTGREGVAELATERVAEVVDELLRQRIGEPELLPQGLLLLDIQMEAAPRQQLDGVTDRTEEDEVERQHEGQGAERVQHLAEQVPTRHLPGLRPVPAGP